ncbi:11655_t:CDS:2, partial [Racocetra fulgida]
LRNKIKDLEERLAITNNLEEKIKELEGKNNELEKKNRMLFNDISTYDTDPNTKPSKKTIISAKWPFESPLINAFLRIDNQENETLIAQYVDPLPIGSGYKYAGTKFDVSVVSVAVEAGDMVKYYYKIYKSSKPKFIYNYNLQVVEGTEIAVVEAMKMQNILR